MRITLFAAGLTLSSFASAQTQIPIPAFTNTYAQPAHTRGFWFQAPVDFIITGLRVPDETFNGTQNVEVIDLGGVPPTYPTTATGTSLFYANNQPSATVIPCNIPIAQGTNLGILGACGTTTMNNSYGAGGFASSVLGQPITLVRFLTQTNLNTSNNQPFSQVGSSLARVEVYVVPAVGYATKTAFGTGCNAANPLTLDANARPVLGTTISLDTTNIPAGSPLGSTLFGLTEFPNGISLAGIGMPGCFQYITGDAVAIFTPAGASGSTSYVLPNNTLFAGVIISTQSAVLAPGANPLGVLSSNGLRLLLDIN